MRRLINRPSLYVFLVMFLLIIGNGSIAYKIYLVEKLESAILHFIVFSTLIIILGSIFLFLLRRQQDYYHKQHEYELEQLVINHHYEYLTRYANDIILLPI